MQGIAECGRALALDRNLTTLHSQMGLAKIFIGCPEETEAHINDALRLSPRDTFAYIWIATVGPREALSQQRREGGRVVASRYRDQPKFS